MNFENLIQPPDALLEQYLDYARSERNLAETTLKASCASSSRGPATRTSRRGSSSRPARSVTVFTTSTRSSMSGAGSSSSTGSPGRPGKLEKTS